MNNDKLYIKWLGTAGFTFRYGNLTVLLDPYLSRVQHKETPIVSDPSYLAKYIDQAHYIVVSHSHYDHFADTPTIAKMTGAKIIGSPTTLNLSRSCQVPETQLIEATSNSEMDFGAFGTRFVPSLHGFNAQGKVPFEGYVSEPPPMPPRLAVDFKEGGTFAPLLRFGQTKVLHIGSANFIESHIRGLHVDILILCIAWRERVPEFTEKVLDCTKPRLLVPTHYDNYRVPLERGLVMRTDTSLEAFYDEFKVLGYKGEVKTPGLLEEFVFP